MPKGRKIGHSGRRSYDSSPGEGVRQSHPRGDRGQIRGDGRFWRQCCGGGTHRLHGMVKRKVSIVNAKQENMQRHLEEFRPERKGSRLNMTRIISKMEGEQPGVGGVSRDRENIVVC